MEIEMIAHYGSHLPKNLLIDKYTERQIEIYGAATIAPGGQMITLNIDDLRRIKNERLHTNTETSTCN